MLTDGRTEKRTPISHPATSRCDKNSSQISSQFPEFIRIIHDQKNHDNHLDLFKLKMVKFAFEINTYTFENGTY